MLSRTVRYVQEACDEQNKQKEKCDKREKLKAYRGGKREKWKGGRKKITRKADTWTTSRIPFQPIR